MAEELVGDDRFRLRLSLRPALKDRLQEVADALAVDPNTAATFALSLGVRLLHAQAHIAPRDKATLELIGRRAGEEMLGAFGDAGVSIDTLRKK
jgi:hypothetical protein